MKVAIGDPALSGLVPEVVGRLFRHFAVFHQMVDFTGFQGTVEPVAESRRTLVSAFRFLAPYTGFCYCQYLHLGSFYLSAKQLSPKLYKSQAK